MYNFCVHRINIEIALSKRVSLMFRNRSYIICCSFGMKKKTYVRSFSGDASITEAQIRDRIMHKTGREKVLRRLDRMKRKLDTPPEAGRRGAGVLVPLCIVDDQLSLLYNLRSPLLSAHAGQVCFPGGKMSKSDTTIEDAALRETEEEIGVQRTNVEVWASLAQVPDRTGKYSITPVLGYMPGLDIPSLKKSEEVLDVFAVSLNHLLRTENQSYTQFRNGWKMPVFINGKYNFWGITACLTEMILINAFPEHYQLKFSRSRGKIYEKYM